MTDKKLTDEEIKKALECLSGEAKDWDCDKCPFDSAMCTSFVAENALYLINHQQAKVEKSEKVEYFADKTLATLQAENERLQVENQSLRGAANSLKMHYKEVQAEIERLKAYNENLQTANTALSNEILDIKSEAVKEFAEQIFELFPADKSVTYISRVTIKHILKEMVGDRRANNA